MAEGFRWTRRGYAARLEPAEARLLRGLFKDVATLLTGRREDAAEDSAAPARDAASTAPTQGIPGEGTTTAGTRELNQTRGMTVYDRDQMERVGEQDEHGLGRKKGGFWAAFCCRA